MTNLKKDLYKEMIDSAMSGQRVYTQEPQIRPNPSNSYDVLTGKPNYQSKLFSVISKISWRTVENLKNIEYPNANRDFDYHEIYTRRLIDFLQSINISQMIGTSLDQLYPSWPYNDYEEWLSEMHPTFTIKADFLNGSGNFYDYKIHQQVFGDLPKSMTTDEYIEQYNGSIIMVKLGM